MVEKQLRRTGVVHSERFKDHVTGDGHPENPSRIGAIGRAVKAPSLAGRLSPIPTRSAEHEEILLVHTERLYQEILSTQQLLASEAGIFGEPASAASLAGLIKLSGGGMDFSQKKVVCVVTGTGLKDTETALKGATSFLELPADLATVEHALGWD